jgi:hypothetical protein
MPTPQSEIERLLEEAAALKRDYQEPSTLWVWDDLAFSAAYLVVQYKDPALLEKLPEWIDQRVREMRDSYVQHGRFGFVSNVGSVDHSELMRKLTELLPKG